MMVRLSEVTKTQMPFTPKVLANFSPGSSFGNPGRSRTNDAVLGTLKGSRWFLVRLRAKPFRVPLSSKLDSMVPGLPELNPGLKFANTFDVKIISKSQAGVWIEEMELVPGKAQPHLSLILSSKIRSGTCDKLAFAQHQENKSLIAQKFRHINSSRQ